MKVHIDISIFVQDTKAFGQVSGSLDLPDTPYVGTTISLMLPTKKDVLPCSVRGFSGNLRVTNLIFAPQGSTQTAAIAMLEDLVLDSSEDAKGVMVFLENGFGLFGDQY